MMSDVVAGAVKIRLGDVICQDIDKTGPADGEVFTYVDISSIDRDSKKITDAKKISAGDAPSRAKQRLKASDVLVSMTRPNLNAVAMVPNQLDQAIGSTGFHILRTRHADPKYIFNLVQTREFIDSLCQCVQGALYPAVRPADIESFEFLLPPAAEQQRIVAKLEELFSELDQGVENLRTAQQQLKVYRQALLKHAFEGKLTAEWRAQNPDKLESAEALLARIQQEREARYRQQLAEWQEAQQAWEAAGKTGSKPAKPKALKVLPPLTAEALTELPELPDGWNYIYLAYLGDLGRGKSKHRPRNDPRLFGGPYPFIQTGEVKSANRVVRSYSNTYSEFGLEQSKLWPKGTLCITIAANIAETAFLGFDGCFPDSVVGLSAIEKLVNPEYVDFFIQGARARIEAYAPATAQKNINLETLENLVIPLCCGDEQKLLMQILDERFSIIDQLENTITTSLQQAEALRQSILKKAFSGQLVPQHPDDEPASLLLERIRAERAVQEPTAKRGRKVAKPA